MKNAEKLIANTLSTIIGAVAIGAAAQLSISFPEGVAVAPVTGQSLAVLLIAHLLGWKWGGLSILIYLILGAIGLPVFSEFSSGLEVFQGPSIGYLIGFLIAGLVVGKMAESRSPKFANYLLEMLVGSILILLCGGIGLLKFLPPSEIFAKGILPFLAGAFVKIILGAMLLSAIRRFRSLLSIV